MSTLRECAEYHELQAKLLENTRRYLASAALPTNEMERDIEKHKRFAVACREADGEEYLTRKQLDAALKLTTENSIRHVMEKQ